MADDSKQCRKCGEAKPVTGFRRNATLGCWQSWCRECEREYQRQVSRTHREQERERLTRWRKANREHSNEVARQWQSRPEAKKQRRQYRASVQARVFTHYGTACACCGSTSRPTIDHINGGGAEHRRELFGTQHVGSYRFYLWLIREGFPGDYQTLCVWCNQSKGKRGSCQLWHGDPAFKNCSHCRQTKPVEDFHRNRDNRTGRASWCAACMSAYHRSRVN